MKKLMLALLLCVGLSGLTSSCRDLPLIGDLAGQWQILTLEYPDGTVTPTTPEKYYYYCFYRHTAQLFYYGLSHGHTANMDYDNPDITLEFPYMTGNELANWGITVPEGTDGTVKGWTQHYVIEKLDDERLVLRTDQGVTITMRRY